ncbi:MgtC/SapB family protein [bacterium]|nr:MgtC/SapB family protein [bacterium]
MEISELDFILRLVLAAFLGGAIGLEREAMNRAAGLRTNVLVSVGSALFTVLSFYYFIDGQHNRDSERIAAQVVSGIGFLGAGTIMKQGVTVRGLTTAATLWVVAAIGMSCGAGAYILACSTSLLTLLTLIFLHKLEKKMAGFRQVKIKAVFPNQEDIVKKLCDRLAEYDLQIYNINVNLEEDHVVVKAIINLPKKVERSRVTRLLTSVGANEVDIE